MLVSSWVIPQLLSAGWAGLVPGIPQAVLLGGLCGGDTVRPSPRCGMELSGAEAVVNGSWGGRRTAVRAVRATVSL